MLMHSVGRHQPCNRLATTAWTSNLHPQCSWQMGTLHAWVHLSHLASQAAACTAALGGDGESCSHSKSTKPAAAPSALPDCSQLVFLQAAHRFVAS